MSELDPSIANALTPAEALAAIDIQPDTAPADAPDNVDVYDNSAIVTLPTYGEHASEHAADYSRARKALHTVGRGATALAISVVSIAGTTTVTEGQTSAYDTARSAAEMWPDKPFGMSTTTAIAPDNKSVRIVTDLLNQPTNPVIANIGEAINAYQINHPNEDPYSTERRIQAAARADVAGDLGLTVFDDTDTVTALDANREPQTSPMDLDDYIDTANKFLGNYGISITADNSSLYDKKKDMLHQPTTPLTDSLTSRLIIKNIVQSTAAEPKEYTDMLGIKHYLLVDHAENAAAYINSQFDGPEGASIVYGVEHSGVTRDTLYHEQAHRAGFLLGGGTRQALHNDPAFYELSGRAPYGKIGPEPAEDEADTRELRATEMGWLRLEDYEKVQTDLENQLMPYLGTPDCMKEAREGEQQLEVAGDRTVLTTTYSAEKNTAEREAELMKYLPQGDRYPDLLSPNVHRLGDQLRNRLGRLYEYRPRIARFFIGMAEHGDTIRPQDWDSPTYLEESCRAHPQQAPQEQTPQTTGGK
jgi:hypothetical protein